METKTLRPRDGEFCRQDFPCLANIYVLAGLEQACKVCAPNVTPMREMHGYEKRGDYFYSNSLAPDQQRDIEARIKQR
jgi:hypothetical protein